MIRVILLARVTLKKKDGRQNYLVFKPLFRYFKLNVKLASISSWKSKRLSAQIIESLSTSNIGPIVDFYGGGKIRVKFIEGNLTHPKISYNYKKVVNICIAYERGGSSSHNNDPTLKNCLSGAVTLTKNADFDKYGYSGYWIGFARR